MRGRYKKKLKMVMPLTIPTIERTNEALPRRRAISTSLSSAVFALTDAATAHKFMYNLQAFFTRRIVSTVMGGLGV